MKPTVEDIISRRRRLSAEYNAKQGIMRKEDVFRAEHKAPSAGTSDTSSVPRHGPEYTGVLHPAPAAPPVIQERSSGYGATVGNQQHPGDEQEDMCHSPKFDMKLPSVEDIVARRRRPSDSSESQPGAVADRDQEKPATPALIRALEAAGCCATPRTSGARRRSLDSFSAPVDIYMDELASDESNEELELPAVVARRGSLPSSPYEPQSKAQVGKEEANSTSQQLRALAAAEVNLLQNSSFLPCSGNKGIQSGPYKARATQNISIFKETVETERLPSGKVSVSPVGGQRQTSEQKAEHGERNEDLVSKLPPRDCSNVGRQKQERCTGPGLGRHMYVVPPPRRRVELSEYYVGEVVIVKRDKHVWVFAQVKMLSSRGIKVWVPSVAIMVNVPVEIMYTHLRKLDDTELQKKSELAMKVDDQGKQERIPLPATFNSGKTLKVMSSPKPPKPSKKLHLVRPAHLAHRTLHQPLDSALSCTICFQIMSPMDAHKPWGCEHTCHLFCYELLVQSASTSSISCNTCSANKSWDWKTITCQCGFAGFVQKRVDDLQPPPVCPSCLKLSPSLVPYQASPTPGSQPAPRWSGTSTSSSSNPGGLTTAPFEGSQSTSVRWDTDYDPEVKLPRQAINIEESEWRHVICDCGLRATIRVRADSSEPPICPACFYPVSEWTIPCKDDLLKSLLGYTPPTSPTSTTSEASTSSSQPASPVLPSKMDGTKSPDFSLFDGVQPPKISPSKLLAPINTPSSRQSTPSPALSEQSDFSSPMSGQISPQSSSSAPLTPPKAPSYSPPSSMSPQLPSPSSFPSTSSNQPQPHGTMTGHKPPGLPIPQSPKTPIAPSPRKPPRSPAPSPGRAPPLAESINQSQQPALQTVKPRQLPTDSLSFRITPAKIRQQMKDQATKQTTEILQTKSKEPEQMKSTTSETSRRDMPADSVSMWMTPAKVKQKVREEELRQQRMQDPPTVTNQPLPSLPNEASPKVPKKSSSTDSVSMWMTPELIKQMVREQEMRQQVPEAPTVPAGSSFLKQAPASLPKKSSSTDSVSMWMTPELIKQMAMEDELRQQVQEPKASAIQMASVQGPRQPAQAPPPVPKQAPPTTPRRDMPADSVSMWMTPARIKKMVMEEELRKQQQEPPKPPRRELPTDSVSLWMTPAKLKRMAMEEESRGQMQDPPVTLGEELRKPIITIEEQTESEIEEEEEVTIKMPDPSTSIQRGLPTDSMSFWMTPDKLKQMQAQQISQITPGFIPMLPSGSEPLAKLEEEDETEEDVSTSQPQQSKPVQTLKKLPLILQDIPEEEEVTHRLSPETPSLLSSASSSTSSSPQQQHPEPTSLATRLQKLKAKKSQTSPPHILPDIPNQPDQTAGIPESGWITIVKDGHARLNAKKKELEEKAKELESERGIQ